MGKYVAPVVEHLVLPARISLARGEEQARQFLGREVPSPFAVRLIIDTGSKRSTLTPEVVEALRLQSASRARVVTSLAAQETELYWVRVEFPGTSLALFPRFPVVRLPLPQRLSAFHGLVGRDMLRRWDAFLYEGRRGRFSIRDIPGGLFGWLRRS